jgi:hypothetical protein
VSTDAVFVDLERDGLLAYPELLEFRPKAGDLIVWHARAIHKIDGPADQDWGKSKRRVLGGTVACDKATYESMGRALFSDMGEQASVPATIPYGPEILPAQPPAHSVNSPFQSWRATG